MASIKGILPENLREKILNSKIFVVGAGGIGCEILKNLVLTGFIDIEIIDLDTIDVSNLNRQFLFHSNHVGKSKAVVARETALSFNPNVNIKAYHDSITSNQYGVNFFQRFNLVLNALDNKAARNHVNRMCLTANIPLIESGTAGYDGQVELIKKGLTQCYECTPKAAQKTYPGCTIRNTPSEPIHCIVWAKHLFNQLFGEYNADEDVSPDTSDPATVESNNFKPRIEISQPKISTRAWSMNCQYNAEQVFNKLFHDDILYLLTMSNLWKERIKPNTLRWNNESGCSLPTGTDFEQKIWTVPQCMRIFTESIEALRNRVNSLPANDNNLVWDKDDKHSMDFVTACANIRALIFDITLNSRFTIKSMAGNIIPAIATTNAITAGIVVLHAFNALQEQYEQCKSVYVRLRPNARGQIFVPDRSLISPNLKCYVCAAKPELVLHIDTNKMTVKAFREEVLIKTINMISPDVTITTTGNIVISSEEGETDENDDKKLNEMSIVDGCILKADDYLQNYELDIIIKHINADREDDLFKIITDMSTLDSAKAKNDESSNNNGVEGNNEVSTKKQKQNDSIDNGDVTASTSTLKINDSVEEIVSYKDTEMEVDDGGEHNDKVENCKLIDNKQSKKADADEDDVTCITDDGKEANSDGASTSLANTNAVKRKNTDDTSNVETQNDDNEDGTPATKRSKIVNELDEDEPIVLD